MIQTQISMPKIKQSFIGCLIRIWDNIWAIFPHILGIIAIKSPIHWIKFMIGKYTMECPKDNTIIYRVPRCGVRAGLQRSQIYPKYVKNIHLLFGFWTFRAQIWPHIIHQTGYKSLFYLWDTQLCIYRWEIWFNVWVIWL